MCIAATPTVLMQKFVRKVYLAKHKYISITLKYLTHVNSI